MTAKTAAALKSQYEETDPADHNDDLVDSAEAAITTTATATELDYLDGSTPGTAVASKAAVLGTSKELDEVHAEAFYLGSGAGTQVTSTAAELNKLDGVTATTAKINKVDSDGIVRVDKTQVDASAGGTAQTASLTTLPASSILLDVAAVVDTAFDGDATTTFEVGISGNADKYIDQADFDPSAAADTYRAMTTRAVSGTAGSNDQVSVEWIAASSQLIATWTNTASATAGNISVYVAYADMS